MDDKDNNKALQNDIFIDRIIDALRDHVDAKIPTDDEAKAGSSLWRTTTPMEYVSITSKTYKENTVDEIRLRIHQALMEHKLDRALFLMLALSRLPPYYLSQHERQPWGSC